MREVLPELVSWWRAGGTVGVATVVATFNSAPRPAGASMLVGPEREAVGFVSGGCVESAVYDLVQYSSGSGASSLQRYGVGDDSACSVGLTCGGILDVFITSVDQATFPELVDIADDVESGRPGAVATMVEHPDPSWVGSRMVVRPGSVDGSFGSWWMDSAVAEDAWAAGVGSERLFDLRDGHGTATCPRSRSPGRRLRSWRPRSWSRWRGMKGVSLTGPEGLLKQVHQERARSR